MAANFVSYECAILCEDNKGKERRFFSSYVCTFFSFTPRAYILINKKPSSHQTILYVCLPAYVYVVRRRKRKKKTNLDPTQQNFFLQLSLQIFLHISFSKATQRIMAVSTPSDHAKKFKQKKKKMMVQLSISF